MYEKKTTKLATFKLIFISICLLLTVTLITGLVPIPAFSFLGTCVGAQNAYAQEGEDDGSKGTGDGEGKEEPKAEENGSESADKTKDGAEGQSKEGDESQPKEESDGQGDTDSDKEDGSEKDKDKKDKDSIFDVNQFTLLSDKEMTGSGQSNDPFVVYNAEQLVMVLSSFSSSYICLGNDIELETDIDGVERYATSFNGYLEGNGHTISQNAVEIYKDYSVGGGATSLFTGLDDGAVIKNLNLNMSVSSNEYVSGLLANELSGKVIISNCSFSGTVKNFSSNESIVGGVVGRVHSDAQALFENITSDVEVISLSGTVRIAGGIVGKSESADVVMNNCTMEESSTVSATGSMSVAFKYAIEVLKLIVGVLLGKASVEWMKHINPKGYFVLQNLNKIKRVLKKYYKSLKDSYNKANMPANEINNAANANDIININEIPNNINEIPNADNPGNINQIANNLQDVQYNKNYPGFVRYHSGLALQEADVLEKWIDKYSRILAGVMYEYKYNFPNDELFDWDALNAWKIRILRQEVSGQDFTFLNDAVDYFTDDYSALAAATADKYSNPLNMASFEQNQLFMGPMQSEYFPNYVSKDGQMGKAANAFKFGNGNDVEGYKLANGVMGRNVTENIDIDGSIDDIANAQLQASNNNERSFFNKTDYTFDRPQNIANGQGMPEGDGVAGGQGNANNANVVVEQPQIPSGLQNNPEFRIPTKTNNTIDVFNEFLNKQINDNFLNKKMVIEQKAVTNIVGEYDVDSFEKIVNNIQEPNSMNNIDRINNMEGSGEEIINTNSNQFNLKTNLENLADEFSNKKIIYLCDDEAYNLSEQIMSHKAELANKAAGSPEAVQLQQEIDRLSNELSANCNNIKNNFSIDHVKCAAKRSQILSEKVGTLYINFAKNYASSLTDLKFKDYPYLCKTLFRAVYESMFEINNEGKAVLSATRVNHAMSDFWIGGYHGEHEALGDFFALNYCQDIYKVVYDKFNTLIKQIPGVNYSQNIIDEYVWFALKNSNLQTNSNSIFAFVGGEATNYNGASLNTNGTLPSHLFSLWLVKEDIAKDAAIKAFQQLGTQASKEAAIEASKHINLYDFITEAGVPYDSQPVPAAIQNRFDFSTAGVAAATMSQAVASAVKALPVSDDLGEAHWNGYAGGLIGYYEGNSNEHSNLIILNSENNATVSGGHAAGGVVGYAEYCKLRIETTSNKGTVSVSDYNMNPSAGGFLGSYKDASNGDYANIKSSLNFGPVLSRDTSGGFIGHLYDDDLDVRIVDCGNLGSVAAPDSCGGLIGSEDSVKSLLIENCYVNCEFDVVSLDVSVTPLSKFTFTDFDIIVRPTSDNLSGDRSYDKAGALIGDPDDNEDTSIVNTYYIDNVEPIGDGEKDDFINPDWHAISKDMFNIGAVCWTINNNAYDQKLHFGQIIDNLKAGSRELYPNPIKKTFVYKDEYSNETLYTNFDPRFHKLHKLHFESDKDNYSPQLSTVNVEDGKSFGFEVYDLDEDELNFVAQDFNFNESDTPNEQQELKPYYSSEGTYKYIITNIKQDHTITIKTKESTVKRPDEGCGTAEDPFILKYKSHLKWFADFVNKEGRRDACAKLDADIDMSGFKWTPLCSPAKGFGYRGVFDGNGHSITGLKPINTDFSAFFAGVEGGTVKNLTLSGNFENAIFAYSALAGTFENCIAKGSVSSNKRYCGGIVAAACSEFKMDGCVNEASIKQNTSENEAASGGMVGYLSIPRYIDDEWDESKFPTLNASILNCYNKGNIMCSDAKSDNYGGGIVGLVGSEYQHCSTALLYGINVTIDGCVNDGNLGDDANNASLAGMLGCFDNAEGNIKILHSINNGAVGFDQHGGKTKPQTGAGIVGWMNDDEIDLVLDGCLNKGPIYSYGNEAGGLIGMWQSMQKVTVKNSVQLGSVDCDDEKGFIVGNGSVMGGGSKNDWSFENCYYYNKNNVKLFNTYSAIDDVSTKKGQLNSLSLNDINWGRLTFLLNGHTNDSFKQHIAENTKDGVVTSEAVDKYFENDKFGQAIDILTDGENKLDRQYSPVLLNSENTHLPKSLPVYYNENIVSCWKNYTNYKPAFEDLSDGVTSFKVTLEIEGGHGDVAGKQLVKKGETVEYSIFSEPGYILDKFYDNDEEIKIGQDNKYTVKDFSCDHTFKVSFTNQTEAECDSDIYNLSSLYDLNWFASQVNSGNTKIKGKLTGNIVIVNDNFIQIATDKHPFIGSFDGNEKKYTISMYNCSKPLFHKTKKGASISNLVIDYQSANRKASCALLNYSAGCTIDNVEVTGSIVNSNSFAAGIVSKVEVDKTEIKNSVSNLDINNSGINISKDTTAAAGGMVGWIVSGSLVIDGCVNRGNVKHFNTCKSYAGGALGWINGSVSSVKITNFKNYGDIYAWKSCGGVVGMLEEEASDAKIEIFESFNYGYVLANWRAAGIFGCAENSSNTTIIKIYLCENAGSVSNLGKCDLSSFDQRASVGGIFGTCNDGDIVVLIDKCINSLTSMTAYSPTGGLVGDIYSTAMLSVFNSFSAVKHFTGTYGACAFVVNLHDEDHCFNNCYFAKSTTSCEIDLWNDSPTPIIDTYEDSYWSLDEDGYSFIEDSKITDLYSGKYTYLLNNDSWHYEYGKLCDGDKDYLDCHYLGQVTDLLDTPKEFGPHVHSPQLYKSENNDNTYSNYKDYHEIEKRDDGYCVFVSPMIDSFNGHVSNSQFVTFDKDVNLEIVPSENTILSEFTVNGIEIPLADIQNSGTYNFSINDILNLVNANSEGEKDMDTFKSDLQSDGVIVQYKFSDKLKPAQDSNDFYIITNEYELNYVSDLINKQNRRDLKIKLDRDIDMSNFEWKSWNPKDSFTGIIDGCGYTISGLHGSCDSFIRSTNDAVIKNINLVVNFSTDLCGVVAYNATNTVFDSIKVAGKVQGDGHTFGGIIADAWGNGDNTKKDFLENKEIDEKYKNCLYKGVNIINCQCFVELQFSHGRGTVFDAGICAYQQNDSNLLIWNCANYSRVAGNKEGKDISDNTDYSAGILAFAASHNSNTTILDTHNYGKIVGYRAAGILGGFGKWGSVSGNKDNGGTCHIERVSNNNEIFGSYVGGIVSDLNDARENGDTLYIDFAMNNGYINASSNNCAAGCLDYVNDDDFKVYINNFGNTGKISANDWSAGGIIGVADTFNEIKIQNSYNAAKIESVDSGKGNFIGKNNTGSKGILNIGSKTIRVENCFYLKGAAGDGKGKGDISDINCKERTQEQFANGQVCYELNKLQNSQDLWTQIKDNASLGAKQSFPMVSNKVAEAIIYKVNDIYSNYSNAQYTLNFETNGAGNFYKDVYSQGAFVCNGEVAVEAGSSFKYAIVPADGNVITELIVDGVKQDLTQSGNEFTFNNISSSHSVKASFDKKIKPVNGDGTLSNPFILTNYSELLWFSSEVNRTDVHNEALCAELGNDITSLNTGSTTWQPIGTGDRKYSGTFDGKGHSIINLRAIDRTEASGIGFIKFGKGCTVQNVNFKNVDIEAEASASAVIYDCRGCTISNVHVTGKVYSAGDPMGGIVCYLNDSAETKIIDCTSEVLFNTATHKHGVIGGIAGSLSRKASAKFINCINKSEIHTNTYDDGVSAVYDDFAGGIVGYIHSDGNTVEFNGCKNFATVKGDMAGGMVAAVSDSGDKHINVKFIDCANNAWVCGDYCGGLVGIVDDVADDNGTDSKFTAVRCENNGMVGMSGTVLSDAGGLIGYSSDGDADWDIYSCVNRGVVLNTESSSTFIDEWSTGVSAAIGGALSGLGLAGALSLIPVIGVLAASFSIFIASFALLCVAASCVVSIVKNRYCVKQYAGGICGEFEAGYATVEMKNTINVGYVDGTTHDDGICPDVDSTVRLNGVFSLDQDSYDHDLKNKDGIEYVDATKIANGYVAYKLQQVEKTDTFYPSDSEGFWGQIIDNLSLGDRQAAPVLDNQKAVVYERNSENGTTYYSNFKEDSDNIKYKVNVNVNRQYDGDEKEVEEKQLEEQKSEDKTNEETKEETQQDSQEKETKDIVKQDFSDNFDVVLTSNLTTDNMLNTKDKDGKVQKTTSADFKSWELPRLRVMAKEGKSVYDVSVKNQPKDMKVFSSVLDDGTITKVYNPTFNDENILVSFYSILTYYADGSVYFMYGDKMEGDLTLDVKVKNNPIKLYDDADGKTEILFPWNASNILPDLQNNFYLTNDVTLSQTYKAPAENCGVALNGHVVILKDNSNITVPKDAKFKMFDFDDEQTYAYQFESDKFTYGKLDGAALLSKDNSIRGGFVYREQSENQQDLPSAIINNYGSADVFDMTLVQSQDAPLAKLDLQEKSSFKFDADVLRIKTKETIDQKIPTFDINNSKTDSFVIGKNFNTKDIGVVDIEDKAIDFYANNKYSVVTFKDAESVEEPYVVDVNEELEYAYLTDRIGKFIYDGHNCSELFTTTANDYSLAYYSKEVKDVDAKLTENNICIANNSTLKEINVNVNGCGNVYPSGSVKCKSDSYVNLHYVADDFATLNSISKTYHGQTTTEKNLSNDGQYKLDAHSYNLDFNFVFLSDIPANADRSSITWHTINKPSDLLETTYDNSNIVGLKMESDIDIDKVWNVGTGYYVLDLNGHMLRQTSSNKNVVVVNDPNTYFIVTDSSIASTGHHNAEKHYFKKDSNGYFVQCDNEADAVCIEGGIITGANMTEDVYYKRDLTAGAVVVEDGTFVFHAGNISGNNAKDVLGASGVTVKENAKFNMYKDANISYNTVVGTTNYSSSCISAGVLNYGISCNNGTIANNIAYAFASSAVNNADGQFTNAGIISNNSCQVVAGINAPNPFATVLNSAKFTNKGQITNNKNSVFCPAVMNVGEFVLSENSLVADNTAVDNEKEESLDIVNNSLISFDEEVANITKSSVILNNTSVFTKDWINCKQGISEVFKLYCQDEKDGKVIAQNNNFELVETYKDNVVDVEFSVLGNGKINLNNGLYVSSEDLKVKCEADESSVLASIYVDDQLVECNTEDSITYSFGIYRNDTFNHKVDVVFETLAEHEKAGEFKNWYSKNALPSISGKYKLQKDVYLDGTWNVPDGCENVLDLNGHYIWQTKSSASAINIAGVSVLKVMDSNVNTSYKLSFDEASGFRFDRYGDIEIKGGFIGGVMFNKDDYKFSVNKAHNACVNVGRNACLTMEGGSIACNYSQNGEGVIGLAVDSWKTCSLSENVNICYNYSASDGIRKERIVNTTALFVTGVCESSANIYRNINNSYYATVAVFGPDANFVNKGKIYDNEADNGSVAGVYVDNAKNCENKGFIVDNIAKQNSTAACEIFNCTFINSGVIQNNIASEITSTAGIYVCGTLILAGKCVIDGNFNKSGKEENIAEDIDINLNTTLGAGNIALDNTLDGSSRFNVKFEGAESNTYALFVSDIANFSLSDVYSLFNYDYKAIRLHNKNNQLFCYVD